MPRTQSDTSCECVPSDAANKVTYQITSAVNQISYGIHYSTAITEMIPSQLSLFNVEDERIRNLIFQIRMSYVISYRERIATNLLALNKCAEEMPRGRV